MYNVFEYDQTYHMHKGGILPKFQLAYETWGTLNEKKDNAILIFTGLSANSHAKSTKVLSKYIIFFFIIYSFLTIYYLLNFFLFQANPAPGWWEDFIGDKLAIDTEKFFVICCNNLGSCFGST